MPSLSRPDGRAYALGLLVLALALVYLITLHWWWTAPMLSMGAHMDDLRDQELRMRMLAHERPAIEKRLVEMRQIEAANPGFLPEATVELAQAGLVQRMEKQVAAVSPDHGACTISQRTPTAWGVQERYQRVVVQVRLLCGISEFSALLHTFENGRPQLFLANLNIISRRPFLPENTPGTDPGAPLDIAFDLYGYLRPGTAHAP